MFVPRFRNGGDCAQGFSPQQLPQHLRDLHESRSQVEPRVEEKGVGERDTKDTQTAKPSFTPSLEGREGKGGPHHHCLDVRGPGDKR